MPGVGHLGLTQQGKNQQVQSDLRGPERRIIFFVCSVGQNLDGDEKFCMTTAIMLSGMSARNNSALRPREKATFCISPFAAMHVWTVAVAANLSLLCYITEIAV